MAFDPSKTALAHELEFDEGSWPTSVAFLGCGRRLAAGNRDGSIYIWELPEEPTVGKSDDASASPLWPQRKLVGHSNGITRLVASRDGKLLFSASLDRTVRIWSLDAEPTGKADVVLDVSRRARERKRKKDAPEPPPVEVSSQTASHVLEGHGDWVNGLDLSRDGRRLISGDDAGVVIVRDAVSRKELSRWQGYRGNWVSSAALSSDGELAFVGEYCSRRGDFDRPPAQACIYSVDGASREGADREGVTQKVDILAVQFPDVKKRDNSYGFATKWGKFVARGFVTAEFSPDDRLLAVGQGGETGTGRVHLIEVATGKLVRSVSGHKYGVTDLTFSDDGKHILSAGRDTTIRISRVEDGEEVAALGKPRGGQFKDWIHAVALSPQERSIAGADIIGKVSVWRWGD